MQLKHISKGRAIMNWLSRIHFPFYLEWGTIGSKYLEGNLIYIHGKGMKNPQTRSQLSTLDSAPAKVGIGVSREQKTCPEQVPENQLLSPIHPTKPETFNHKTPRDPTQAPDSLAWPDRHPR